MVMTVTIWHNPRCSKSRQTLALLEKRGLDIVIRRYLEDAPSLAELNTARTALDRPVAEWVRKGERVFKELGLYLTDDEQALLDAMASHPILIERPIVFAGNTAAIGRPPEAVLKIL